MRNLLALVGAVVVLVVGLGWYLGWYQVGTEPSQDGHRKINVDVNTGKIKSDLNKGRDAVGGVLNNQDKVEGQPTGFQRNVGDKQGIVPSLPAPPSGAPIEFNPDGTPRIIPPPPPPSFPGNK
ncbi:MAG: hypothetical protein HYX68_08185 [Planctomycetes bacterium]|jgi:hypothetical protein|nr:hypothetical protein [Planctomycetota bacterium]